MNPVGLATNRSDTTITSINYISRARLVMSLPETHVFITVAPTLGGDGKDCRAYYVHAPFPETLSCVVSERTWFRSDRTAAFEEGACQAGD